ncbi:MAG: SDR family oxidoreductase [Chloroflexi bacterium]|nr:SDR family oxidoreductase [Chloroflexota bacterium]MYF78429.1 SDR family oxidoreductase [Chloroflexota bacterium]MYK62169.1 SDR family oxidoreductase [Chloroflexota bacterium]
MAASTSQQLDGRSALVTGGGRGIGRGISMILASRGAEVCVSDIDPANAEQVAAEINEGGGQAFATGGDVTDIDSISEVAQTAIDTFGKLDICVPNAGVIGGPGFMSRKDYIDADWDMTWDVNVRGVVNTADAVAEHMKKRMYGKIVIIASHGGRQPRGVPDVGRGSAQGPYMVSKAAAIQWTHWLAMSLGQFNINVNAVCPGRLWTPMWQAIAQNHKELNPDLADMDPREIFEMQIKGTMPLGREQTPEDIGKAVAFLASDDASEITGQALNVNGGAIMN